MAVPLVIGLVLGGLALIALAIYANRPRVRHAQHASAHTGADGGYTPLMFGGAPSADPDCGSGSDGASDGGAGCGGDGGGGGGGGD